ncbi:MAG TPA: hypothetical protein VF163_19685 [Micromonosporaceae bacterium]
MRQLAGAVPGLIRHLPHHKPWMVALSLIAVAVVTATCGMGSYLLVRDESTVVGAAATPTPTIPKRDITSRANDPTPLTAADVFPDTEITADPSIPPYKRIGKAQVSKDCRLAATSDLGKLLSSLGCNQVVRATFLSPDGTYYVTGGIFNLRDEAAGTKAEAKIKDLVDAGKGRFTGYIANAATRILGRAPTQLSWDAQGHFLIYSVIARKDGKELAADDAHLRVMVYDIVEKYLRDTVIERWSIDHSSADPSAAASPSG